MAGRSGPTVQPLCRFDGGGTAHVRLTQRQLDGWACFYCGKEPTTMLAVGTAETDPPRRIKACVSRCRSGQWLEGLRARGGRCPST